jgi:formate hydrogenlyase subunit 3/multisubunit Na+/H+ antiporter MnhD subunit
MTTQFTIKFTEEHIKYAVRGFFTRYVGIGLPIMFSFLAAVLVQQFFTDQTDWLFGLLLALLVMGVGVFVAAYFQRLGYALRQLKKMGDCAVHYEFTDERIKAVSSLGSTEVKWEVFKALWIFPRVWLLMFDKASYLTFPSDQLSEETKNILKQKVAAVGGKIK